MPWQMTCDIRMGFFSVKWILHLHRVDATNLIETAAFRQGCRRPSSWHRSSSTLWTFAMAFCPPDNSSAASTTSQCPRVTWSLSSCHCCTGDGVSSSASVSAASSARSSSSARTGSRCAAVTCVYSGTASSSSAVSRNLCAHCLSRQEASPCITVSKGRKSPSLLNGPILAIAS